MAKESVVVREVFVPFVGLPSALDGIRVAHITDLHFRRWNRVLEHAQQLLQSLSYDLLAVTGDLSDVPDQWPLAASMCRRFFEPITPPCGIYGVLGNHDVPRLAAEPDLPLRLLRNECIDVAINGAALPVAGVEQTFYGRGQLARTLEQTPKVGGALLLAHYPSTVYELSDDRVALILSGHTHGGQIRLPWIGCVWPNDAIPRHKGQGLQVINGTALYVSTGIGVSGPIRRRFLCPPEIAILTLRSAPAAEGAWARPRATPNQVCEAEELPIAI